MKELSIEEKAKRYDEAIDVCRKLHNKAKADKIEPKFRVGDKIIEKDYEECDCGTIIDIKDGKYIFDDGSFICIEEQGLWQLVAQKPVVIPKFRVGDKIVEDNEFGMVGGEITGIDNTHYELDGGCRYIPISHQDNYKLVEEQNPAWSEEDNIILSRIIADYERSNEEWFNAQNSLPHGKKINWLKSLKDRCLPQQKQEWSEDDDIMVENIRNSFGLHCGQMTEALKEQYDKFFNKVKSLRLQSHWKPSGVQMKALRSAIHSYGTHCGSDPLYHVVLTLEKDLRAL